MRKTISINSPTGSGNVFFEYILTMNLEANINFLHHEVLGFDTRENTHNIFLLRNPYEVIASGIEIRFLDTAANGEKQSRFFDDVDFRIQDKIIRHLADYNRFVALAQRFDHEITTISFEFLINNTDKCLEYISKKFEIPFSEKRFSSDNIKERIKNTEGVSSRVPREKSELRKKIDIAVKEHKPMEYAYNDYVLFRDKIQSTENMV